MQKIKHKAELLERLATGAELITPNNRLSAHLLKDYFTTKPIAKPRCYPYSNALKAYFEQLKYQYPQEDYPLLLNQHQYQYLWKSILKDTPDITYSDGLLHQVITAWKQCEQWLVSSDDSSFNYTMQTQLFQSWWCRFNQQLTKKHLITEYHLVPYLLNRNSFLFTQPIIWVCFDEFTPQQIRLQEAVNQQGIEQYYYDLNDLTVTPHVLKAENQKEEYQQLIFWLTEKIKQQEKNIGVVVPNLQQEAGALKRLFHAHFASESFNISLGEPLSTCLLVAHALTWLALDTKECTNAQATLLLQSPYLGYAKEEFIDRVQFLQDNHLLQKLTFSLALFSQHLSSTAPKLAQLLSQITDYPHQAPVEAWIHLFQQRLNQLGFPGNYGLNSESHQVYQRLLSLFDEFRTLQIISPILAKEEAFDAFTQLSQNTIFQVQKTDSPIKILGLLEASGGEYDSLWVMGLTDQCLPQKVSLSAFIPPTIQRGLLMPHSSAKRELRFAQQTLCRLQAGARNTVIFSYPSLQGETPNLACSLLTEYPFLAPAPLPQPREGNALVALSESYQIPIKPSEVITGGTTLLGNQAKCPFKAFAEHRLHAKAVQSISDGLDHKEKGKLLHKVMEIIWQQLKTQQALLCVSQQELDSITTTAIHKALAPLTETTESDLYTNTIHEIEYNRLKRLVARALTWEKQRPAFTILELEQSYTVHLDQLSFAVRIDRLDQVGEKKWVIDYKSTLPSSKPWHEERPKEPQLLLYALLDPDIDTILFLQLKTGNLACSGLSAEKQEVDGIASLKKDDNWQDVQNRWQQQLLLLVQEIQLGHCPPQPESAVICSRCDFKRLCRIT